MQKILDKIKNEPMVYSFRKVWKFAKGYRWYMVLAIVLEVGAQLVVLTEPWIFSKIIKEIEVYGTTRMLEIYKYFMYFAAVSAGFYILHGPARVVMQKVIFYSKLSYTRYVLNGVFNLPMSWHSDRDSGDTIDKINKSKSAISGAAASMIDYTRMFVRLFGTVLVLFWFNTYVALLALLITIIAIVNLLWFNRFIIPIGKKLNEYDNKISAGIFDSISNINSVIVLQIINPVLKRIDKLMLKPYRLYMKDMVFAQFKWFSGELWFAILVVVPLLLYITYVSNTGLVLEISIITAMYMYLSRMSNVFFNFAYYYDSTIRGKVNLQNAQEIWDAIEANKERQAARKAIVDWEELEIEDLNFSYNATQSKLGSSTSKSVDMHLDNVSLKIGKGERIAFIGESGSGKTTFLKVLHGLYDSASAKLTTQSRQGTPSDMQTNFTDIDLATMLVPQEPEIFSSTIKENITLGLPTKAEEINKVLRLARFDDVVEKLPKGLESVINEKGVNLSGGQKQRLALARALLFAKDKQVLLLDESTSSVDPENEAKIYEGIFSEYRGKTILASIHKMNLLKYFDRVVIFKDGKVVDQGTFDELLESNKSFKKDWEEFVKSRA